MYPIGEVVTLNIDKHEGAGAGSLTINAGVTGMIVNNGSACGEGNYAYIVDFGPEGQWNCFHNEITSVANPFDDSEGWDADNDVEIQQDITEEEASRIYADESIRPSPEPVRFDIFQSEDPSEKDPNKKIDFEADLARMVAEAERKSK